MDKKEPFDYKDNPIQSNLNDIRLFCTENIVWKDLVEIIKGKIWSLRNEIEVEQDSKNIIHMQGEIYSLRVILDLPIMIENELKIQQEKETENEQG